MSKFQTLKTKLMPKGEKVVYRKYFYASTASAMALYQAFSLANNPNDGYWEFKLTMMVMALLWVGHGTTIRDSTIIRLNAAIALICLVSLAYWLLKVNNIDIQSPIVITPK